MDRPPRGGAAARGTPSAAVCSRALARTLLPALLALALGLPAVASAAPAPPSELRVIASGDRQVALSWSPPDGQQITGYEVLRDGARAGITDAYTTSLLDNGLAPGSTHVYTVVALEGTQRSAPSDPSMQVQTAASVQTISSCSSTPLPGGHYVLANDLLAPPGHPCVAFESLEGVTLDCRGHSIVNEIGPTSNQPGLSLRGVSGFLVTDCNFYDPDPLSRSDSAAVHNVAIAESNSGMLTHDTFAAGQGVAAVESHGDADVAFAEDVFLNTKFSAWDGEEDYLGASTLTFPAQGEPRSAIDIGNGRRATLDGNTASGDAALAGDYSGPGADDVITATNEREDVIVGNALANSYDCGYETIGLAAAGYVANNSVDNAWASGICSYWATSWLGNSIIDNLVSYSGALFVLDGTSELPEGQTSDYMFANRFEGNVLSHGAADLFGRSAEIASWAAKAIPLAVGGNILDGNDFGSATSAPFIEQLQPPIIGAQSGNACQAPSVYLECQAPSEPPAQPPRVADVYPAQGPEGTASPVVIEGSGFTGADAVHFGALPGKILSVSADTRLVAEAPAAGAGAADVTVTTPVATSPVTPAGRFQYGAFPVVESVLPASGPAAGGTALTITGSGFTGATAVDFGSTIEHPCGAPPCFTVSSPSSISATSESAPAPEGYVNVTVTTPTGTSAVTEGIWSEAVPGLTDRFTYIPAPVVTGVTPSVGPEGGGTVVTITGRNLERAQSVSFGGAPATSVTVESASELTAIAPSHSGTGSVDVTVSTAGGTSATEEADQFAYGPPSVAAVRPAGGGETGGTLVTISGERFQEVRSVRFGSTAATGVSVKSPGVITAIAPSHAPATVPVTVTTAAGTSAVVAGDRFAYVAGRPVVSGVRASSGPEAGGTRVTISGKHFEDVEAVTLGLAKATAVEVKSASEIRATTPGGTGVVNVGVTSPLDTSAVSTADRFTYVRASSVGAPSISRVQSNAGPLGGGTRVMISGANFQSATGVLFGQEKASAYSVLSASAISAIVPAAKSGGAVDVRVLTPSGESPTIATDRFSYRHSGPPVAWGANSAGELGDGVLTASDLAVQAADGGEAIALSGGQSFTLALMAGGTVEAYGEEHPRPARRRWHGCQRRPGCRQRGRRSERNCGRRGDSLALRNGHVLRGAKTSSASSATGRPKRARPPGRNAGPEPAVTAIAAGGAGDARHELRQRLRHGAPEQRDRRGLGSGALGQLGDGSTENSSVPMEVGRVSAKSWRSPQEMASRSRCAATARSRHGGRARTDSSATAPRRAARNRSRLRASAKCERSRPAARTRSRSGQRHDHGVGLDFDGQLGDGSSTGSDVPVELGEPDEAVAVAAGDSHSLALLASGETQAWGENVYGELGDGISDGPEGCGFVKCSRHPVTVDELGLPAAIAAGAAESLAAVVPAPRVTVCRRAAGPKPAARA